jgi:hypothetical protein
MQATRIAGVVVGRGLLLGLQAAVARTVTQTSFGSNGDGCQTDVVRFDQAHLAPGETLTSVTMTLGAAMSFAITPRADTELPARVALSAGVMVNGPGIPDKPVCFTFFFDLLDTEFFQVEEGTLYRIVDMGTADVSPTPGNADYIGPGTVDVFVSSDTDDSCTTDVFSLCEFDVGWDLSLTYVITPGPRIIEPSSMSLLLGGMGAIGLARRRRGRDRPAATR